MPNSFRIFLDRSAGKLLRAPDSYQQTSIQDAIRAADDSQIPIEIIPLDQTPGGGYQAASYATDDLRLVIGNNGECPCGGTFELVHSGNNSDAISVEHLNADVIERALNNISSIDSAGGVQVTRNAAGYVAQAVTNGVLGAITADEVSLVPHGTVSIVTLAAGTSTTKGAYQINLKADPYALLTTWSSLSAASIALSTETDGTSTLYETQKIAITGAVAGGYFTITDGTTVSAALAFDASASDVEDAVNAVLGASTVTVTKPDALTWKIRWAAVGNQTALTVTGALTSWSGLAGTIQLNTTSLAASIAGKGSIDGAAQIVETIDGTNEKVVYSETLSLEEELVSNATLTTIATGLIPTLKGSAVFTAPTQAAESPDYIGQVGVETDTGIIYRANGTGAGNWTRITHTDATIVVNYTEFAAAIAAIGTSPGKIVIADDITLTATATIPVNCSLEFPINGKTINTGGFDLNIHGSVIAGPAQQIFTGYDPTDIKGQFGGATRHVGWWGAVADFVPGLSYFGSPATLNITAGSIAVGTSGTGYKVAGGTVPTSDDLATITGSPGVGDQIILYPADDGGTIVVKNGTGNIALGITGGDKTLARDNEYVALEWDGANWNELAEGAIDTGTGTDSTAEIQAAINSTYATSGRYTGKVKLSAGNYHVSDQLDLTDFFGQLSGEGAYNTSIYPDDVTGFANSALIEIGTTAADWGTYNTVISDFTFRGRTSPLSKIGLVYASDDIGEGTRIERMVATHCGASIISVPTGSKCMGLIINDCHFGTLKRSTGNNLNAIYLGASCYTCRISNTTINTQQAFPLEQTGIYFDGLGPLTIDGVHFEDQLYNVQLVPANATASASSIVNCNSQFSNYPIKIDSASNRNHSLNVVNFWVDSANVATYAPRTLMIDYQVGSWLAQEIGGTGNGGVFSYSRQLTLAGTGSTYVYRAALPSITSDPNYKPSSITDTIDSISGNEITMAAHTFPHATRVMLTNDTSDANLPGGLNGSTHYYIKKKDYDANVVTLALQPGGTDVAISSAGTGVHTLYEIEGPVATLTRDGAFRVITGFAVIPVDTYASAASDDLTSIVGGYNGQRVTLKAYSDGRTVVVKHDTGTTADTIHLHNGRDAVLRSNYDTITLLRSNNVWLEEGRSLISDTVENYTIATGVVTIDHSVERIFLTGEGGVADNLDTINGGYNGQVVICSAASSSVDITAKDATGNLSLAGDFVMDHAYDTLTLVYWQSTWKEMSRSGNSV